MPFVFDSICVSCEGGKGVGLVVTIACFKGKVILKLILNLHKI